MNRVDPSKVYRLLYPAVPAILSCNDRGLIYAMPVASMMALSGEPPLVAVASSPKHATHDVVVSVRSFSLCWLDASMTKAVEVLGSTPHTSADKLQAAGLRHSRGAVLDVPIIEGCAAALECSLYARQSLGDHELLVGKVQNAAASEDFQEYWRFERYRPILYTGSPGGSFKVYEPR
ncbi:MAG TPA: flavin reductase family protein [Nitrososphaerales archaeon]|nr:flavin reductase family protein [Nitrososphaerales archaeon]